MTRRVAAWALCAMGCTTASPPVPDASPDAPSLDASQSDASTDARSDTPTDTRRDAGPCPGGSALPYPAGDGTVSDLQPMPDLALPTADGTLSFHTLYTPCAEDPAPLVIRVMADWSGPARWHASHTARLRAHEAHPTVVDVLVLGAQNLPATVGDLTPWRARYDVAPDAVAIDPAYRFRALYFGGGQLPLVVIVDPRTMRTLDVLRAPWQEQLDLALTGARAQMRGMRRPTPPDPALVDNRFTADQWAFLQTMSPVPSPPADPSNRVADDAMAARWGERLFHDPALSSTGTISCATCHDPAREFTDGRAHARTIAEGGRNTPSVRTAAWSRWQFWDGRADSLWAQALGPPENPIEMGGSRLAIAHLVAMRDRSYYEPLFGALPPLDDTARFPAQGHPGDATWSAMTAADRDAVTRVYVNVGKAIAAYERTLRVTPSAFDRYVAGDMTAMTPSARNGLRTFLESGCAQCHHGPLLLDDSFHNIGLPSGAADNTPDEGRWSGATSYAAAEFRRDSMWSDARETVTTPAPVAIMHGQFKTPTLRHVAASGPWGHGGTVPTLERMMLHYAQSVMRAQLAGSTGAEDVHLSGFHMDDTTLRELADLLRALSP